MGKHIRRFLHFLLVFVLVASIIAADTTQRSAALRAVAQLSDVNEHQPVERAAFLVGPAAVAVQDVQLAASRPSARRPRS